MFVPKNYDELWPLIDGEMNKYGPQCSLNHIDVSNIHEMDELFKDIDFNGDVSRWDVSNVTNMSSMFDRSKFNGDISKWDVSNVTDMTSRFYGSPFNGNISKWNVSKVKSMARMFCETPFNQDISEWNVWTNDGFQFMFAESPFAQDISKWKIRNHNNFQYFVGMLDSCSRNTAALRLPIINQSIDKIFKGNGASDLQRKWLQYQPLSRFHWEFMARSLEEPWITLDMRQHFLVLSSILEIAQLSAYEKSYVLHEKWNVDTLPVTRKNSELLSFDFESSM